MFMTPDDLMSGEDPLCGSLRVFLLCSHMVEKANGLYRTSFVRMHQEWVLWHSISDDACPVRQWVIVTVLGSLPSTWGIWMQFWVPGFDFTPFLDAADIWKEGGSLNRRSISLFPTPLSLSKYIHATQIPLMRTLSLQPLSTSKISRPKYHHLEHFNVHILGTQLLPPEHVIRSVRM